MPLPLTNDGFFYKSFDSHYLQFVPMGKYLSRGDTMMVQASLAKEVLAEVPDQFLGYMRKHGINPPQSRTHQPLQPQASAPPP